MRRDEGRPGLYRDSENGKLGGVCSGVARWTGVPSVVWRLIFTAMFFGWGTGLVLYVLLWFLMDDPPKPTQPALRSSTVEALY